ncbi:hypothetical protein FCM82_01610 [Mycoplasma bovis]|nr:hypothetical protein [Mycoplasmopsis bovis]
MEQGKFVKLDENQEKHIRGGFSITATIAGISSIVTIATKIASLVKLSKAKKGEVTSTGSTKWDTNESKTTVASYRNIQPIYQPVYVSY